MENLNFDALSIGDSDEIKQEAFSKASKPFSTSAEKFPIRQRESHATTNKLYQDTIHQYTTTIIQKMKECGMSPMITDTLLLSFNRVEIQAVLQKAALTLDPKILVVETFRYLYEILIAKLRDPSAFKSKKTWGDYALKLPSITSETSLVPLAVLSLGYTIGGYFLDSKVPFGVLPVIGMGYLATWGVNKGILRWQGKSKIEEARNTFMKQIIMASWMDFDMEEKWNYSIGLDVMNLDNWKGIMRSLKELEQTEVDKVD